MTDQRTRAASAVNEMRVAATRRMVRRGRAMEWFLIEALVALAVAAAIVWWTITPAKKLPRDTESKSGDAAKSP